MDVSIGWLQVEILGSHTSEQHNVLIYILTAKRTSDHHIVYADSSRHAVDIEHMVETNSQDCLCWYSRVRKQYLPVLWCLHRVRTSASPVLN